MSDIFKNGRFYPVNFVLEGCDNITSEKVAALLSAEASAISPDCFTGKVTYFRFILRYCPPYEHTSFGELKRLQSEAMLHTRFKDEYKGFILIDINEWLGHFNEELFCSITLPFLADMSEHWKYIFTFSDILDDKSLLDIITHRIWVQKISPSDLNLHKKSMSISNELLKAHKIHLDSDGAGLLDAISEKKHNISNSVVQNIIFDILSFFGKSANVSHDELISYMLNETTYVNSLLSPKDISVLKTLRNYKEETQQ